MQKLNSMLEFPYCRMRLTGWLNLNVCHSTGTSRQSCRTWFNTHSANYRQVITSTLEQYSIALTHSHTRIDINTLLAWTPETRSNGSYTQMKRVFMVEDTSAFTRVKCLFCKDICICVDKAKVLQGWSKQQWEQVCSWKGLSTDCRPGCRA